MFQYHLRMTFNTLYKNNKFNCVNFTQLMAIYTHIPTLAPAFIAHIITYNKIIVQKVLVKKQML